MNHYNLRFLRHIIFLLCGYRRYKSQDTLRSIGMAAGVPSFLLLIIGCHEREATFTIKSLEVRNMLQLRHRLSPERAIGLPFRWFIPKRRLLLNSALQPMRSTWISALWQRSLCRCRTRRQRRGNVAGGNLYTKLMWMIHSFATWHLGANRAMQFNEWHRLILTIDQSMTARNTFQHFPTLSGQNMFEQKQTVTITW